MSFGECRVFAEMQDSGESTVGRNGGTRLGN